MVLARRAKPAAAGGEADTRDGHSVLPVGTKTIIMGPFLLKLISDTHALGGTTAPRSALSVCWHECIIPIFSRGPGSFNVNEHIGLEARFAADCEPLPHILPLYMHSAARILAGRHFLTRAERRAKGPAVGGLGARTRAFLEEGRFQDLKNSVDRPGLWPSWSLSSPPCPSANLFIFHSAHPVCLLARHAMARYVSLLRLGHRSSEARWTSTALTPSIPPDAYYILLVGSRHLGAARVFSSLSAPSFLIFPVFFVSEAARKPGELHIVLPDASNGKQAKNTNLEHGLCPSDPVYFLEDVLRPRIVRERRL
ncbi:hypothetical protein FB451DRAFT_1374557 [Mycena latifolia]|nr:hypothetical protein FB451DRAFT_1374557 [Mycena latifolia]